MLLAGLLFGCMSVFVKLGAAYFSHTELVLISGLISSKPTPTIYRRHSA